MIFIMVSCKKRYPAPCFRRENNLSEEGKNEFTEQFISDLSSGTDSNLISKDEGIMTYYIFTPENFERAKSRLVQNNYARDYELQIKEYEQEAKKYEQEAKEYDASLKKYVEAIYQKMFYGDYMKIPPKEKREKHVFLELKY